MLFNESNSLWILFCDWDKDDGVDEVFKVESLLELLFNSSFNSFNFIFYKDILSFISFNCFLISVVSVFIKFLLFNKG